VEKKIPLDNFFLKFSLRMRNNELFLHTKNQGRSPN